MVAPGTLDLQPQDQKQQAHPGDAWIET